MDICQNSNNRGRDPKDGARLGNSKKGGGSEMRIAAFLPKILQFLNVCKNLFKTFVTHFFLLSIDSQYDRGTTSQTGEEKNSSLLV